MVWCGDKTSAIEEAMTFREDLQQAPGLAEEISNNSTNCVTYNPAIYLLSPRQLLYSPTVSSAPFIGPASFPFSSTKSALASNF